MAETGEMVGASFLSICVTGGAASFGPPKARNLLSSALPFNVVAPLFFWWVSTWHSSETHPEPTSNPPYTAWESERNTRSPPGTHREPSMAEREEPTRSLREPTGNPPGTHPKPYLKQRRPTHWCL